MNSFYRGQSPSVRSVHAIAHRQLRVQGDSMVSVTDAITAGDDQISVVACTDTQQ
jgi:hypothetical protein